LERERTQLEQRRDALESREGDVQDREESLEQGENALEEARKDFSGQVNAQAKEMLKHDSTIREMLRDARRSAIQQSKSTMGGRVLERLIPPLRSFGHDPRDVRAMFDPIDYVLFNGLTTRGSVDEILFIEVKCGRSGLSSRQRSIRDAVKAGRVDWDVWTVGDPRFPIARQRSAAKPPSLLRSGRRSNGRLSVEIVDAAQGPWE